MRLTTDRDDPELSQTIYNGMRLAYLIKPAQEMTGKPPRPIRKIYTHRLCGTATRITDLMALTIAYDPKFYDQLGMYCIECKSHFPLRDADDQPTFDWAEDGKPVGS